MKITIFGYNISLTVERKTKAWQEKVCDKLDEYERANGTLTKIGRIKVVRVFWELFPSNMVISDQYGTRVGLKESKDFIERYYATYGEGLRISH